MSALVNFGEIKASDPHNAPVTMTMTSSVLGKARSGCSATISLSVRCVFFPAVRSKNYDSAGFISQPT